MSKQTSQAAQEMAQAQRRPHDTMLQPDPVCPHCGHRHRDAWEWNFGEGPDGESNGRACDNCEALFDCERVVQVSYTTRMTKA